MNTPRPEATPAPVWEISAVKVKGKVATVEARIVGHMVARSGCTWVDYQLRFETKRGRPSCVGGRYKISNVAEGDAFATHLPDSFLRACGEAVTAARAKKKA